MRFKVLSLLALLSMLLGLTACAEKATPEPTETATPTEAAPEPTATVEPTQKPAAPFDEAPCPMELPKNVVEGQDIVCGYVNVPGEHANPDGDTIRLAVAVIKSPSSDPAPDPLVVEAGGPGVSTLASAPSMLASANLRAQRDIVLVEQRGTRFSEPYLLCEEILDLVTKMLGQNLSRVDAPT